MFTGPSKIIHDKLGLINVLVFYKSFRVGSDIKLCSNATKFLVIWFSGFREEHYPMRTHVKLVLFWL